MKQEFLIETLYDEEGSSTYAIHQVNADSTTSICCGIQFKQTAIWLLEACVWKSLADKGRLSIPKPSTGIKRVVRKTKKKKRAE